MPNKVMELKRPNGEFGCYIVFCPGCKHDHPFDSRWSFNGDFEKPTFAPSMLVNGFDPKLRCHSFVTDGKIQFLSDCHHELTGQTVDLPDID